MILEHYSPLSPYAIKLISLLKCCTRASEVSQIHGCILKSGLDRVPFCLSNLIASSITSNIHLAASIFNHAPNPNLFMFTTLLRGFSSSYDPQSALLLFNNVRTQGIFLLDQFSIIHILKASARLLASQFGRGIHGLIIRSGHVLFLAVKTALIRFYSLSKQIENAHLVFDECPPMNDSVSWNILMDAYLRASQPNKVLEIFSKIMGESVEFSMIPNILSSFMELENSLGVMCVHGYCVKIAFCSDLTVSTSLINAYTKTKNTDSGRKLFDEIPIKDVVSWNCLINGYAKSGQIEKSLALLQRMKNEGPKSNSSTLTGLLSYCASTGCLNLGRRIYEYARQEELKVEAILGTALLDMYSKCGLLHEAINIFNLITIKDLKSVTAMITAYGVHGQAQKGIDLFYKTVREEMLMLNATTFLAALSSCSHEKGMVKEAINLFEKMVRVYGFSPRMEHYGCLIDLLGRAGMLEDAYGLIKRLPFKVDAAAWRALLASCRVYGSIEVGERVKRELEKEKHFGDSLLLCGAYAVAERLMDQKGMREEENGGKEMAGCSVFFMDLGL